MRRALRHLGAWIAVLVAASPAVAVRVAPRITDREIVERLTRVEDGVAGVQGGLASLTTEVGRLRSDMDGRFGQVDGRFGQIDDRLDRMDARFAQIDARFAQIDARFVQIDARFEQIDARFAQIDARFEQVDDRFDRLEGHMNRQFDRLHDLMLGLLAAFAAMTASTIGFAIWDRRSILRPLEVAVAGLRESATRDRGRIDAVVEALRSLGKSDHRLTEILRRLRLH